MPKCAPVVQACRNVKNRTVRRCLQGPALGDRKGPFLPYELGSSPVQLLLRFSQVLLSQKLKSEQFRSKNRSRKIPPVHAGSIKFVLAPHCTPISVALTLRNGLTSEAPYLCACVRACACVHACVRACVRARMHWVHTPRLPQHAHLLRLVSFQRRQAARRRARHRCSRS